jgi:toxin ParE1/3/4
VKVSYRKAASDDVVRQFRYYLVTLNVPEVALRFRNAIRLTVQSLRQHPFLGSHYALQNPQLRNLRFCPVTSFEVFGLYYVVESDTISVIRILHGKRDVRRVLERERLTSP